MNKRTDIRKDLLKYITGDFQFPTDMDFCRIIAKKHGRSLKSIQNMLSELRGYKKLLDNANNAEDTEDTEDAYFMEEVFSPSKPSDKNSAVHTTVCVNDIHVPFEDKKAVAALEEYFKENSSSIDALVINGDLFDCYAVSAFDTDPRKPLLAEEVRLTRELLSRWRSLLLDTRIVLTEGNHEQRLERLVAKNTGLYGLDALTVPALLGLDALDIEHRAYMEPVTIGKMTYVHGNRVSKHSSYSAKRMLVDSGYENVCIGHVHRRGCYHHTGYHSTRSAYELGHLSDVSKAGYIKGVANWQQGFGVITHSADLEELIDVNQVRVANGKFFVGNKIYGQEGEDEAQKST